MRRFRFAIGVEIDADDSVSLDGARAAFRNALEAAFPDEEGSVAVLHAFDVIAEIVMSQTDEPQVFVRGEPLEERPRLRPVEE